MLLIVGMFAVCFGWYTERKRWQDDLKLMESVYHDREEQIFDSVTTFAKTTAVLGILDKLEGTSDPLKFVQNQRVIQLLDVVRRQKDVNFACKLKEDECKPNARSISLQVLSKLECDHTEDFFEIARSIKSFRDLNRYEAVHNTDSLEHKSLKQFVAKLIGN